MTGNETISISFNGKEYKINKCKIIKVLSLLENRKIDNLTQKQISELLSTYELYDEVFLENINKI